LSKKKPSFAKQLLAIALITVALSLMLPIMNSPKNINTTGLLDTVAKGESNGNYNAYYGRADNSAIDFTSMSVTEVLSWQKDYVEKGSPSSAVGKYQFIRPTLEGLVDELKINKDDAFSKELQDRLAVALLERRGLHDYMSGKISLEQFAHNLSKEWAALPRVIGKDPDASYYAGDGLNKVRLSKADIYSGIATLHN
jgi:conjugal transfer mating pair stabilization protein TraG